MASESFTMGGTGEQETPDKGKGKAVAEHQQDASMDEESSSEEEGAEEAEEELPGEEEEENQEEIDPSNIVGSRTRGKQINFAKAAEEAGDELEDDEEDDEDFQEPKEEHSDAMQE